MTEAIDIVRRVIPVATLESELDRVEAENERLRAALAACVEAGGPECDYEVGSMAEALMDARKLLNQQQEDTK